MFLRSEGMEKFVAVECTVIRLHHLVLAMTWKHLMYLNSPVCLSIGSRLHPGAHMPSSLT